MSLSTSTALSSTAAQQRLESEFPIASKVSDEHHHFSPSTIQPSSVFKFPGVTYESTKTVRQLMEENDRRFHIYQRISYQHNHLPHHLLTAYALGASPKQLEAIFIDNIDDMAPIDRKIASSQNGAENSRVSIDMTNWDNIQLLGNKANYAAYLAFFHSEIQRIGGTACFDLYFLSSQANMQGRGNEHGPRMFCRFLAGVFHPFIHTGFGLEFQDQVMLAEGFAQAAVHNPDIVAALFPPNWPNVTGASTGISNAATQPVTTISNTVKNAISALSISSPSPSTTFTPRRDLDCPRELHHPGLLELYAELCDADKLDPGPYDPDMMIDQRMRHAVEGERAAEIQRIVEKWALSEAELVVEGDEIAGSPGWGSRVEEMQVLCTLLASTTGRLGGETKVDFFLMHCLTSSIFLPSFMRYLTPAQRVILLKSYLLVVFHTALSRGRPRITPEVILQHSACPSPPSRAGRSEESGSSKKNVEVTGDPRDGRFGNPWLEVVESSMYSKDSHVMKSIRSLILYSIKYGHKQPGDLLGTLRFGSGEESIPGISKLGGDIFLRAAGMIMEVMGWAKERREGEKEGWWDTSALGWDDAWKQ